MVKVEIIDEKEDNGNNSPVLRDLCRRDPHGAHCRLVDIVPPTTRHSIVSRVSKTASFVKKTSKIVGNIVWVVTTSALLVALPLALSLEDEAKIVAQEKEMEEQQQSAQQMLSPMYGQQSQPKQLVPPGF
ncbi:Tom22-domain-containing protein [Hymenopellis radicata]|nr:Tom22-domain-containing protein [Hymenopellis radicata]